MHSTKDHQTRRGLRDYFWIAARGYCMGAADVVPGVSGGTMAFILGIYEELLDAIRAVDIRFIRLLLTMRFRQAFIDFPWKFVLSLVVGIFAAILTLARSLSWALEHQPTFVWSFFFGLVLASIFVIRKRIVAWNLALLLITVLAAVGAYLLVGMVPVETPDAPWFLFLSGAIAINAMILPGISGAFILVLLGKYQFMLDAVVQGDFVVLFIVICGALVGLLIFARILRWLLRHYHDYTVAVLIGLIIGALRKVWPWKEYVESEPGTVDQLIYVIEKNVLPETFSNDVALALGLMVLGFILVIILDYLAAQKTEIKQE